jgi:glyoxylase-like metal-dependent hydrolase (beta-lactamase superfamily II)
MTAIRQAGKINANTTLIDLGMERSFGITAVYLVQGAQKCLIDGGSRAEAPRLLWALRDLEAFPPDLIIVTHPHHDHAQGVPALREAAARLGETIRVLADADAVPLLSDASFNKIQDDVFGKGPCVSITGVTLLKEGDAIGLGGITLRILDVPGHCRGHIAVLDEANQNIFVGDAIGIKVSDTLFLPPFMPPFWDPGAFLSSVDRLRRTPYETICLAHFGCIGGKEKPGPSWMNPWRRTGPGGGGTRSTPTTWTTSNSCFAPCGRRSTPACPS